MKIRQEFTGTIINVTETPWKNDSGKEQISYKVVVATTEDAGTLPCSDESAKLLKTYIGQKAVLETLNDSTSKCYTPIRVVDVRTLAPESKPSDRK